MTVFSKFQKGTQKYFKRNFEEAVRNLIPPFYFVEDVSLSGYEVDSLDLIVNSNITMAHNIESLLNISAVGAFTNINDFSAITSYFIKQEEKTNVTPYLFEKSILNPIGIQFTDFNGSGEWKDYVDTTLQEYITLNNPANTTVFNYTSGAYGSTPAEVHEYFMTNLGWLYFLNTNALTGGTVDPSSIITPRLYNLYNASSYETLEGINDLSEYVWKNYYSAPLLSSIDKIHPDRFASGTATYTSGLQQLEKVKTFNSILYSPHILDYTDTYIGDSFETFANFSSVGLGYQETTTEAGPFSKLIRAMSYSMYDINDQVEGLSDLYDIDRVPEKYIGELAKLIGWDLIGDNPDKWRNQLREAVKIYKQIGTRGALETALSGLFGENVYSLSGNIYELYESYIPFMIHYTLATESPLFKFDGFDQNPFKIYTQEIAEGLLGSGFDYSTLDMETNIQYCVDHILLYLIKNHRDNFRLGSTPFPLEDPNFIFNYRNRNFPIPPYEEIRWYEGTQVSPSLLASLKEKLACFGISSSFLDSMMGYILNHTVSGVDSDINLLNSFIFFTNIKYEPPNFSKILENLLNTKSEYLSLWQGKSSHYDAIFNTGDYTYTKKLSTKATNLGLQRAMKVLYDFTPAHAIPRVKLITPFNETIAQNVYPCFKLGIVPVDLETSATVLNAFACSAVNMGETQLSSTSMSKFLVDNLEDTLISSTAAVTNVKRNSLRRRNYKILLPQDGYHDRGGFNMPLALYSSSLEKSLTPSGDGMAILGYNYSSCEFIPPKTKLVNENYNYLTSAINNLNLFRDPFLSSLENILYGQYAGCPQLSDCDEVIWNNVLPANAALTFGQGTTLDPLGEKLVRPLTTSSFTVGATPLKLGLIYQRIYARGWQTANKVIGWKDQTTYTLSYYIKNYNVPGFSAGELGLLPDDSAVIDYSPITGPAGPNTSMSIFQPDGSPAPQNNLKTDIWWSNDVPSKILCTNDIVSTGPEHKTKIEYVGRGWHRVYQTIFADYSLSADHPQNSSHKPSIQVRFSPFSMTSTEVSSSTGFSNAGAILPTDKIPLHNEHKGVYLWGVMLTEGDLVDTPLFGEVDALVWDRCENLNSINTFNGVDTSNTFPCRGVSSYELNSVVDGNGCILYRDRGELPPIYRTMYGVKQKEATAAGKEVWSQVSSNYDLILDPSSWSGAEAIINSSVYSYIDLSTKILNPNNLLGNPTLVPLLEKTTASLGHWSNRLSALFRISKPIPSPVGNYTASSFLKEASKVGSTKEQFIYQDTPSGIMGQTDYTFSMYLKNIDTPKTVVTFSGVGDTTSQTQIVGEWSWIDDNVSSTQPNTILSSIHSSQFLNQTSPVTGSYNIGQESVGNGWSRIFMTFPVSGTGDTGGSPEDAQGRQFRTAVYLGGSGVHNVNPTPSIYAWGPCLNAGIKAVPLWVSQEKYVTSSIDIIKDYKDYSNFEFGKGIQETHDYYTDIFHTQGLSKDIANSTAGGPNIFSHIYGPLVFNGDLNYKGNETLTASSFASDYLIGEDYTKKNSDKWLKGYTITPAATEVSSNILPYTQNYDPRVTTWNYGGSGAGALAASAVFPPWGPLRWGTSGSVSGPSSVDGVSGEHQFIVQGKNGTNTWDWGSMELPIPSIAEYNTSAQLLSLFVKKIDQDIPLSGMDSYETLHGMTATDVAASSVFFGLDIANLPQDTLTPSSGENLIEFCWSGLPGGAGLDEFSAVTVCSVYGGPFDGPDPSAVTPSDCGNGWWRVGMIVSGEPSSVDFPEVSANGAFTSADSGRWEPSYPVSGTRLLRISPAGFGIQSLSSLANADYKGQFFWGVQLENLSNSQMQAFNDSSTSSFNDLSSVYRPVVNGGTKCFDIAIGGIPEFRDGSILSGIEFVIPSGTNPFYENEDLVTSSQEVTSFTYEGASYSTPPFASYFKAFKISPSLASKYPNSPLINKGCVVIHADGARTPRLRLPLSNTRYPVYRRDYIKYDNYWPESHLRGEVSSVQNSVAGKASIDTTTTDNYLYRRSTPETSGYHNYIYEPYPQVPFSTKTSNLLLPNNDYEFNLNYTSFNDIENKYGGGQIGIWIHTMPEEGLIARPYDQHLNIGTNGWVWSWTPQRQWEKTRVSALESNGGMDIIQEKLAHMVTIPVKDKLPTQEPPPTDPTSEEEEPPDKWDPASLCFEEDAPFSEDEGAPPDETIQTKLSQITEDEFFTTTIKFNTMNRFKEFGFRDLPLSFKRYPISNKGFLHRRPSGERDFQYYVVEVFVIPEMGGRDVIVKDISIYNKTLKNAVKRYTSDDIAVILKHFNNITNYFVGDAWASREQYTTSGTFEASGGSRIDYRISPQWTDFTKDGTSKAYTKIDFLEGRCIE